MSVPSNIPSQVSALGNDTTSQYDFPFRIESIGDLSVAITEVSTGVQQVFIGEVSDRFDALFEVWPLMGGTVRLYPFTPDPGDLEYLDVDGNLKAGFSILITYRPVAEQPTVFRNTSNMTPVNVEKEFDRLTWALKSAINLAQQALRVPAGGDEDPVFPPLIGNENRGLYVNEDATGFTYGPTVNQIQGFVDQAEAYAQNSADSAAEAAQYVLDAEDQVALAEQAVSDAQVQASNAAQFATDAEDAKDAAQQAVLDAEAQVDLATTQANNAAASAVASEVAANRTLFQFVVGINVSDSPYNVTNANKNTMYRVDTTGGDVTVNLPLMSTVDPDFKVGFVKTSADNQLTISRNIGNTINGGGDVVITENDFGLVVWPIFPGSDWRARYFILESASGGAGGGGSYIFAAAQTLAAGDNIAPISATMQWLKVQSSGGEAVLDIDLFSAPPKDGSTIVLEGLSDVNYCVIPNSDTDGGFVGNGDIYLKKFVTVTLVWDKSSLRYKQIGGNGR